MNMLQIHLNGTHVTAAIEHSLFILFEATQLEKIVCYFFSCVQVFSNNFKASSKLQTKKTWNSNVLYCSRKTEENVGTCVLPIKD